MTAKGAAAGPAKPTWLVGASRKQLLLWSLAPWIGIFLIGHAFLRGGHVPTLEGLGIHAFLTVIGSGAVLVGLIETIVGPLSIVMIPIPLAALLLAELFFLRTRKLIYLLAIEILVCSHLVFGILFMVAIMSV
jgi:hypothetical protein